MAQKVSFTVELDDQGVVKGMDAINASFAKVEKRAQDATALTGRLLGVTLPRQLEHAIAKTETLGKVMSFALDATLIGAGVAALAAMVPVIQSGADALGGYTQKMKDLRQAAVDVSNTALFNPVSTGTGQKALSQINREIAERERLVKSLRSQLGDEIGIGDPRGYQEEIRKQEENLINLRQRQTGATEGLAKVTEQARDAEMQLAIQAGVAGLKGVAAIKAQADAQKNYVTYKEKSENEFATTKQLIDIQSQRQAAEIVLQGERKTRDLRAQGVASWLDGDQQIVASAKIAEGQVRDQVKDSVLTHTQGAAQIDAIWNKAYADLTAAERAWLQAGVAGFRNYADHGRQLRAEVNGYNLAGIAQIDAAQNKQFEDEEQLNDDAVRAAKGDIDKIVALNQQLEQNKTSIAKKGDQERQEYRRQFALQTAQIDQDAAILSLQPWQRADAQIVIDFQRTIQQIELLKKQDVINSGQYNDREVALARQMNAQLADSNRQLVEQMGQDLQSVFDSGKSIGQQILANAKKLFFQIIAQWFLVARGQGGGGGLLGGLLGSLVFGPGNSTGQVVFGGAGGGMATAGAGGIGSLLGFGGGFGVPSSTVGGTYGGGALGGGVFSLTPGGASAGPGAGTSSTSASSGGSLSSVAQIPGVPGLSLPPARSGGAGGILGGGAKLTQIGALLAPLLGSKYGGTLGGVGGGIAALYVSALAGNPAAISLLAAMPTPLFAGLGFAAGGLIGFGVGSQHGKLAGSIAGGLSGAGIGAIIGAATAIGGPLGAAIGAIIGLLGGIFGGMFGGGKRKKAANNFVDQQVMPQIQQIEDQFFSHQLDFATANQDLLDLKKNAEDQLKQLKGEGKSIFKSRVIPAIDDAMSKLQGTENERERRLGLQAIFGPPQFHSGGYVSPGYTVHPGELLAKLRVGEYVVNPQATAKNREALEAMNNGQDVGGDIHFHLIAWDGASVDSWLRSGGARKIKQHLQRERAQYAS
jgi:hypothetical protein